MKNQENANWGAIQALLLLLILLVAPSAGLSELQISASEAIDHVGQAATVCGVVKSVVSWDIFDKHHILLDLDKAQPDHVFTIVVLDWSRHRWFQATPDSFSGREICVFGVVEKYAGRAQMVFDSPEQLVEDTRDIQEWDY